MGGGGQVMRKVIFAGDNGGLFVMIEPIDVLQRQQPRQAAAAAAAERRAQAGQAGRQGGGGGRQEDLLS